MKSNLIISCVMMLIIVVTATTACTQRFGSCKNSIECCSHYCRDGRCINFGDVSDDHGIMHPCRPSPCRPREACVIVALQCQAYPCRPFAMCYP